jgi:hypothetical protein
MARMSPLTRKAVPAVILLAFLGAIALGTSQSSHTQPHVAEINTTILDCLERIAFGGTLENVDYATIRRIAAKNHRISANITSIEIRKSGRVEVWTGPEHPKMLSGGGDLMILERRQGKWAVTEHSTWVG